MKKTVSLTQDGKKNLENELKSLIKMRPAIADRLATARSFGDLKENQEYSEGRILEIQDILKNAEIIKVAKSGKIAVGSTVKIKMLGKEHTYSIVGAVEADPLNGRISDISPIGKALIGKKEGDEYTLPNGNKGEILEVA